jgi:uncharacterized repeat protein (TIGR01451 family)
MIDKRVLGKLLAALLIGLVGAMVTLLFLSQGASARPMLNGISLSILKSQSTDHVQVGAQLVYTLTYQNTSTDTAATGVVITDTMDDHVTFVSASRPPSETGNVRYWSIGPLVASESGTIVLTVTVDNTLPNGTIITNTAAIDSNETVAQSTEITATVAAPTLELAKRDDPDPVTSGAPLTYTLAYTNTGDATAAGVVITDVLDSHVAYVSASPTPTNWTSPTLYWSIGSLTPSTSGEIVISVTVQGGLTEDTTITNSAAIDSEQTTPLSVIETTSVLSHSTPVSVTLTPTSTTIPAGQPVTYALTAHDTFGNDWIATSSVAYTITSGAGGTWVANVYTAEKDGTWTVTATYVSRMDTAILTVTNVAPIAVISGSTTGVEGELLTFDASLSEDPGNDITSYGWDFDYSGTFVTDTYGIPAAHVYPDNRDYTLALQVTDDNGAGDIATATIAIDNVAPLVEAGSDRTVNEAQLVSFSGSFTDTGSADTHTVRWDFGDGAFLTNTLAPTHVYTEPGSLQVTLTITDDDGGVGSDDLAVTVQNLAPTVDAGGPYSGTAGTPVTLIASGSDPGGGPLTYTWDLDDDGYYDDASGDVVAYTWTAAGTHTVAVQAADSGQVTDTDTAQVSIGPADLSSIVLSPPTSTILAGQAQAYTVEAFDVYSNSRGMVTAETTFSIVESGHGGTWVGNVYTSANYGDWTVRAVHTGTSVVADTASLRVLAPDLRLAKSADRESVEAGDCLTYTLTYSNAGNQTATSVVITDALDINVDYVAGSASRPPTDSSNGDLYWSLDPLGPGNSGQITFSVQVHRPLPNHTILTNNAWIDADRIAPVSATQVTTVTSRPVLTITKTGSPDIVEPNGILRYTLVITNSGNENATPVTITEHYDDYVSFFYAAPSPSDPGSGNRTWIFPSLNADESRTINIFVQADGIIPMGTVLTNQATLESGQTAPMTATETTPVSSTAKFTFYKQDLSDPVQAGALLEYVIHYDNHGDSPAYDVVITETYDSRVTFVSASPAPSEGDNVWNIGDLAKGAFGDIRVTVRVPTPLPNNSILTNHATIKSAGMVAKICTQTTRVSSAPALTFIVTDTPDPVEAGAPLTYTLRYTNAGNADATDVVVTATFDSNVSFSDSDATPPPDGGSGQVWHWDFESIPGEGGSGEIVIRTNVTLPLTNGTKLNFTAQLADAEGDFLERTAKTTVHSAPALSLLKSNGVSSVGAGDRLTYTLTYANSGNENAYHVTITDTLSPYVEYIGCDGCQPPDGPDPDTVVFHISAITQTSGQIQLFVQVQHPLPAGADFVENHARMTHSSLPAPIDASDVDFIHTRPDLAITAADHTPTLFSPGQLMTYMVTYGNVGQNMHAENVIITTVLPTDTVYVGNGWHSSDGQTYTYAAGALPVGSTGHTITFTVRHPDAAQISAPEFKTPFTIAASGGAVRDANPANNKITVTIGVPDLVVVDCSFEPSPLPPNVPVTFTVVVKNQGTGTAWNPESCRGPVCAPFYLDVFINPVVSYPYDRDGDFYTTVGPIEPGTTYTYTIKHGGFEDGQMQMLYVKVDNHDIHFYGLVPESVEMNNVAVCGDTDLHHLYLPLVKKQ